MKYKYKKYEDDTDPSGYTLVPEIRVRLFYREADTDVRCVLDSGADDCLFHSSVAKSLGIDLTSGRPKAFFGVGGEMLQAYMHPIELRLNGFNERIQVVAGFSEFTKMSVLGQRGVFDNYEVTFRGYRRGVEIKSRTHIR
ncbi:MAG: aspartyl protease family protein [Acidobacteria bacterium]|nr:aspartyl protease family protein [Acidobacteriota bacterium]